MGSSKATAFAAAAADRQRAIFYDRYSAPYTARTRTRAGAVLLLWGEGQGGGGYAEDFTTKRVAFGHAPVSILALHVVRLACKVNPTARSLLGLSHAAACETATQLLCWCQVCRLASTTCTGSPLHQV